MIGHEPFLTQTNRYGSVALCSCGWIGGVVQPALSGKGKTPRSLRTAELVRSIALDTHAIHLHDVVRDIERRSELALAALGSDIKAANKTLQRRGRWGHS